MCPPCLGRTFPPFPPSHFESFWSIVCDPSLGQRPVSGRRTNAYFQRIHAASRPKYGPAQETLMAITAHFVLCLPVSRAAYFLSLRLSLTFGPSFPNLVLSVIPPTAKSRRRFGSATRLSRYRPIDMDVNCVHESAMASYLYFRCMLIAHV